MLPTLTPPCTLDPGDPCRNDETFVAFTLSRSINTKPKPKPKPKPLFKMLSERVMHLKREKEKRDKV